MFKKSLPDGQMSDVALVDQAVEWSKELTRMRSRGPGDVDNAMRSIERDYGIDYWTLWTLRYRRSRLRDIGVSIYVRLHAAWLTERERQAKKHDNAIRRTEEAAGADHPAVVAAKALASSLRDGT